MLPVLVEVMTRSLGRMTVCSACVSVLPVLTSLAAVVAVRRPSQRDCRVSGLEERRGTAIRFLVSNSPSDLFCQAFFCETDSRPSAAILPYVT